MNAKELSKILNGCQIGNEVPKEIELLAKENNLVIVFGASDDLMEFRGAIYDEVGAYDGGTAYFDSNGLIENKCDCGDCPYFIAQLKHAPNIRAVWCATEEYSWTFETSIPHETFDVLEDDDKYCRGIVFSMDDLK